MSFEMNKIAAAILVAMIVAMVSGIIASKLVEPTPLAKNAYEVAVAPKAAPSQAAAPKGPPPIEPLLATASVDAGKAHTAICQTCHTFDKGGPNKIGPNLYAIVGNKMAEDRNGFAFSDALKNKAKQVGGVWTVDNLNAWLTDPQEFAPGTKMTFAGFPKAKDRADVIAYLNSLSDHPQPLPTKAPTPAAAPKAAAAPAAASPAASFDKLLATANPEAGKAHTAICQACHTFNKGGPNRIGPNLYGVVGGPIAEGRNGFDFSDALKTKGKGQTWTFANLDAWLTNPQDFAHGTKMTFGGFPKAKDRADVIAYLDSLSDHPVPLPKAAGK
jgi:cytochrome c